MGNLLTRLEPTARCEVPDCDEGAMTFEDGVRLCNHCAEWSHEFTTQLNAYSTYRSNR